MFTCTFAGHREVYESDIPNRLRERIETILDKEDQFVFYNENMGKTVINLSHGYQK